MKNIKKERIKMQDNNKLVRRCSYNSYGYPVVTEIQFLSKRILGITEAIQEVGGQSH